MKGFLPGGYSLENENARRKEQFIREYRAKLKSNPVYALSKLLYLGALTDEDLAEASRRSFYKVRNWAYSNLGEGDYTPADEGMPREEAFA